MKVINTFISLSLSKQRKPREKLRKKSASLLSPKLPKARKWLHMGFCPKPTLLVRAAVGEINLEGLSCSLCRRTRRTLDRHTSGFQALQSEHHRGCPVSQLYALKPLKDIHTFTCIHLNVFVVINVYVSYTRMLKHFFVFTNLFLYIG